MNWTSYDGRSEIEGERVGSVEDLCNYTIDLFYCPRRYTIAMSPAPLHHASLIEYNLVCCAEREVGNRCSGLSNRLIKFWAWLLVKRMLWRYP